MHLALYLIIYCSLEIVSVEGWMSRKQRKRLWYAKLYWQITRNKSDGVMWNFEFKSLSLCTEGIRTEGQNLWNQHGGGPVTVWGCISARGLAISSEFMELRTEKWTLIHHTIPSGKHQIGNIFFFHHDNVSKHAASAVQTGKKNVQLNTMRCGLSSPEPWPQHYWSGVRTSWQRTEYRWSYQILIFKTCSNPVLALYTVFLCMFTRVLLYCCTFVCSKIFRNEGWLNICAHFLTIWVHDSIWKQ